MKIKATIKNTTGSQDIALETDGKMHSLSIPPREGAPGSSVNGGELLFLALATCFCNDLYREARKLELNISGVEVEVEGEFGKEGEPARHITYRARIRGNEGAERLQELARVTDRLAEIQNTLRAGIPVSLEEVETESLKA
jgi:organic hydroperoxide reductase OsmC/OhrA